MSMVRAEVGKRFYKPKAHEPQCSPEWTAIKASFNILDFQLPWQQIKMRNLYNFFATQQTLIKTFCQNTCTCSEIAIKTYFHFSHYKSMETLSCHSNESTWATAIKNINYVEADVMNISARFQRHAPYGFWFFLYFFANSSFWLP